MNDCELLEMAAKAAGVRFIKPGDGYDGSLGLCLCDEHNRPICDWNPLADDGDALRLAVKLKISPIQVIGEDVCAAYWSDIDCRPVAYKNDPYAATRLAIVRAAAKIGKLIDKES